MKNTNKQNWLLFRKLFFLTIVLISADYGNAQCWTNVSTGQDFSIARSNNGTLWAWGLNVGIYGNGTTNPNTTNNPVQIGTATTWSTMATTFGSCAAIRSNGTLWTWGQNSWGELGNGNNTNNFTPQQVGTATNWVNIAGGRGYACYFSIKNGALWAWGSNQPNGQLGNGTIIDRNSPVQIGTATNWKTIYPGYNFTIGIKTDGTLWSWGSNPGGVLGDGTPDSTVAGRTPRQVGTATDWKSATCGNSVVYAIKNNGTLWGWGGTYTGTYYTPVQMGTANDWSSVAGSYAHTAAIKTNGTLWTWGNNTNGELGNGTYVSNNLPTQVGTDTNWESLSLDQYYNSFAKKTNGEIWGTGRNLNGQLGNGTTVQSNVFVKVSGCPAIIANPDSGTSLSGVASTAVANVRSNDTYNGVAATSSNSTLAFSSATNSGITLNTTTGAVAVAANVPVGTYTLNYTLCATANPLNCTTGTVTISVTAPVIDAINDNFSGTPISYATGGSTASVTLNDLLNGAAAVNANLTISLVNNGGLAGATISSSGIITIPAGTFVGTFNLTYQICQTLNPTNCDQATVTVVVFEPIVSTPNSVAGIRANNLVDLIDIQTGGKIIIGGPFTTYNNLGAVNIARLNTDLTLDTTFTMSGSTPASNNAYDMKIQNDNKIILVGQFTGFNGGSNGRGIIRLNADGTVDTSFNFGGSGVGTVNDRVRSCAIQIDGKILLGGSYITSYNGVAVKNMIRLNPNGSLDTTFNYPYGVNAATQQLYAAIFNIVVQPDGKILVAGIKNSIAGGQPTLFRLNSDGTLDGSFTIGDTGTSTFTTNCTSCSSPIQNVVLQPDGKILVVGSFDSYNTNTAYKNIVRLTSTGAIDGTFNGLGTSTNRVIKDLALDAATGKMFVAGEFTTFNGVSVNKIIRLNSNGSIDTTFNSGTGTAHTNTGSFVWNSIHALKRQGDGKVILGGLFTSYNGVSTLNITRIQPTVAGGQARIMNNVFESDSEINMKKELTTNNITIYPNPSNGIFTIDLSGLDESYYRIEIYNFLGSIVYDGNLTTNSLNEINLSALQDGYYIAKIYSKDDNVTIKLMKN